MSYERTKAALIATTFTALCFFSPKAAAQTTSFVSNAGSCSSQGSWTQKALEQANTISQTAQQLQDDPHCQGLALALGQAPAASAESSAGEAQASYRAESITSELEALRTVLRNSPNGNTSRILNPILARTTLDSMTRVTGSQTTEPSQAANILKNRFAAASGRGLEMLNALFTTLPQYQKCVQERPDLAGSLFVGGVRMAAAFASGGQGISPKFAATLGNFLNYLQNKKFAAIQKGLNQQKFWTEISCLVETTQANYCAVQDGFELLKSQKQQAASSFRGTPLEGYFIMSREVPEISAWIRKIQVGIEPRLTTDAQFKKDTWGSIVRLYSDTYDLPATYYENYNTVYKNLTTVEQKQNNIRQLLATITQVVTGEGRGTNFFTQASNAQTLPFFLLGRDAVPREVIAAGAAKIQIDDYLLDLELTPELKNPDDAMARIIVRLRELMDRAMIVGAEYFRSRMSVDQLNLVDESVTASAITSRQALMNTRGYLQGLALRLHSRPASQTLLPSLMDTMSRIDRILKSFDALDQEARKLGLEVTAGGYSLSNLANYDGERRRQMTTLFENIITSVYLEFNILLQRDGFFATRLGTYVRHDYFSRAQTEDFSQYTNQLMITAGHNILDRLQEVQKFNVAEAEADLSNANVINMSNLEQLENLTVGHIQSYLLDLNKRSGHSFAMVNDGSFLRGIIGQRHIWYAAKQDRNNEAENVRAKVCIQTLGFKRYRHFMFLCRGAKLKSTLVARDGRTGLPLEFDYNTLLRRRMSGDSIINTITNSSLVPTANRFSQVCNVRDYFRNNLVAWMTKDFGQPH